MNDGEFGNDDMTGIIKESKKALREQRDARLRKSLRDNLGRRKLQIRARNGQVIVNEIDV